ncbi:MAG: M1 family aminopeptidase [Burkholderiales bacterium]
MVPARITLTGLRPVRGLVALALLMVALLVHAEVPGLRLPRTVVPLAYDARLELDPAREAFGGSIEIAVRVTEPTDLVWLNAKHLIVTGAKAVSGSEELSATVVPGNDDVLGLQLPRALPVGEHRLALTYAGKIDSKGGVGLFRQPEGGRYYAVTQFEPMDARRVFPCFDEPDRKATWKLTLVVPAKLRAFSNMPVESERAQGADTKEVVFQRTPLLSSYLVAFAVGDFDVLDAGRAGSKGVPVSIVAPKGRAGEGAFAAGEVGPLLAAAERYFGMPYPFPKLDLLAYPRATFGGAMENPGLITYDSRSLLARPDELSASTRQRISGITAHELAHMWFGDYVTMAWWDDIWLNEAFASWMGTTMVAEVHPEWPRGGWRSYQRKRAMGQDRLPSARAIRQPITVADDVRTAFDGITYAKGEVVIGMFERWQGRDKFRDGVRRYLAAHAWGNATADDFFAAIGGSDPALVPAFRGFVDRPGLPLLDVGLDCTRAPALKLAQRRLLPPGAPADATRWTFPACFLVADGKGAKEVCTVVTDAQQALPLPVTSCPAWVVADPGGNGYFLPRLSPALYAALPKAEGTLEPAQSAVALGDIELLAGTGVLSFADVLPLAARNAASPQPQVALRGYALAASVPPAMLDGPRAAAYAGWVRREMGEQARRLAWLPNPGGDSPDLRRLRDAAVPFVADRGADTALARKAVQLAHRWIEHRSALPPASRRMVLVAAARAGDPAGGRLFDALVQVARDTKDGNEREDVVTALASFRDPALRARSLALLLDPAISPRDLAQAVSELVGDDANRPATLAWLATNVDPLLARMPGESRRWLVVAGGDICTAPERAQFVALLEPRVAAIEGGARSYRQALESIDLCLAVAAAQQPALDAFLRRAK